MKKAFLVITSVLVLATSAFAQDVFYPGFQLGIKGGASHTVGETDFGKLISPAAALDLGYQISPVFGLRADISGWQGKGWYANLDNGYKFNFAQVALDATFDICNMFGYKSRLFNPYVFLGVGGVGYFNNGAEQAKLPADNNYWNGFKFSTVARAGAGVDIRLSDLIAIELEYAANAQSDKFNSKKNVGVGLDCDWQHTALLGLKFNFGQAAGKKKAAEAAAAAAAAAAAQAAAAQARADKELADAIAAAKAAIERAQKALAENDFLPEDVAAINDAINALKKAIDAKDIDAIKAGTKALNDAVDAARANKKAADEAAEKAAAEKAAAEKAAYEAAKAQALADAIEAAKKSSNVVYYVIGKYDIRNQERYKINNLIKKLKKNPEATAILCGFADRETGTADGNWVLSENRSNIVAEALTAAGIDPSRITCYWYGDTERISKVPEKNRATVLLCK
ncbi:MAG: OmpA family protein [Bacteroidales bacterium]|nr:OmpA family protein [Bacteroidales bacterium]